MPTLWTSLVLLLLAQTKADTPDNPLYRSVTADGLTIQGTTVRLPAPLLADGHDAEAAKAALKTIAGDDRAVQELLKDSVTAPFILKSRDVKVRDATIRVVDLWFVVHAKLDDVNVDQTLTQAGEQTVEAGNMKFDSKILNANDLRESKREPLPPAQDRKEWYTHLAGRLLDRIQVEATDHAILTRSASSLVIASVTDPAFNDDVKFPNRWSSLTRSGPVEKAGPTKVYPGSISYARITALAGQGDALLVETHLAFVEPLEWFDGNPILRSKLGLIAQDQIRRLRREILKKRNAPKKPD